MSPVSATIYLDDPKDEVETERDDMAESLDAVNDGLLITATPDGRTKVDIVAEGVANTETIRVILGDIFEFTLSESQTE